MFKILIVEDDTELNKTVCAFLGTNRYETVGCHFASTVRKLDKDIPILFMTARRQR